MFAWVEVIQPLRRGPGTIQAGQTLLHYRMIEMIGAGGMGSVSGSTPICVI